MDAIIQARIGSTRLPNKIFKSLCGHPLIWHVVQRLKYSKELERIIIATTNNKNDDIIEDWCIKEKIPCYRGSESNVLSRYYDAAKKYNCQNIVRITADDPFKDPEIIDSVIRMFRDEQLDFAYNNLPTTFPEGLDTEVFTFALLENAFFSSTDSFEKEHVTQFFFRNLNLIKSNNFFNTNDLSWMRWTIDTNVDFEMVSLVYNSLYKENSIFLYSDIIKYLNENPEISQMNLEVKRSDMYNKNAKSN